MEESLRVWGSLSWAHYVELPSGGRYPTFCRISYRYRYRQRLVALAHRKAHFNWNLSASERDEWGRGCKSVLMRLRLPQAPGRRFLISRVGTHNGYFRLGAHRILNMEATRNFGVFCLVYPMSSVHPDPAEHSHHGLDRDCLPLLDCPNPCRYGLFSFLCRAWRI